MSFITTGTDFKPPRSPDGERIYFGKVEDRDDPERMGRVRVRLVEFFGSATTTPKDSLPWALVEIPAGVFRFVTPHVDDTVAVYFHRGDVHSPIVKAGIVAKPSIPGKFLTNYPARYGFQDSIGNSFVVDETAETVEFEHKSGAKITINANGQVDITAPAGQTVNVNGSGHPIAKGDEADTALAAIKTAYASHTHNLGVLVTGGPNTPIPSLPATASDKGKVG